MNWIKNIEINNFKSIRSQKIENCNRINLFIGYPNVGKSNILEAIGSATITPSISPNIDDFLRIEDTTSLFFNGDTGTPFTIYINSDFRIKGKYEKGRVDVVFAHNSGEISFETFDKGSVHGNSISSVFGDDYEPMLFRKFSISNGLISDYTSSPIFSIKNNRFVDFPAVKKFIFNDRVKQYDGQSSELDQPFGGNIFSVISANEGLRKDIADLFKPFDLKFPFDKSTKSFKILKNVGDDIFIVSYKMIADTLRRLIFFKSAVSTNVNSVLVFEEPESQMFPPYIKKLTTSILMDKGDNQFFIATHSPYVLDELLIEAESQLSVYLVDYKNGETIIHQLSNEDIKEIKKYGVDLFFNIESYLNHGQVNNS